MKRILLLLVLAYTMADAQVQVVQWSKAANDTAKMAGTNWGIRANFVTFLDGSKFTTALNFYPFPNIADTIKYVEFADSSAKMATREFVRLYFPNVADTSKYVEKLDSLIAAGYATRTMLQADSLYRKAIQAADSTYKTAQIALKVNKADTTTESGGSYFTATQAKTDSLYRAAQDVAIRLVQSLDSTYKAAQLLLRIKYADSTNSPGYVTRTQFRADSLYARAIFALDTTYKAAELLKRILYSDTTSALVKQWIFVRDSLYRAAQDLEKLKYSDTTSALTMRWVFVRDSLYRAAEEAKRIKYSDTTAFPSIVPARNGQSGWWTRPAGWSYLTPATSTDSVLIPGRLGLGSITSYQHRLAIGDNDSTGGINIVRTDKNTNRSTLVEAVDTSSVRFFSTQSGKWQFAMVNNLGATILKIDSTGNTVVGGNLLFATGDNNNIGALGLNSPYLIYVGTGGIKGNTSLNIVPSIGTGIYLQTVTGNVGIGRTPAATERLSVQAGLQLNAQTWYRTATGGTPVLVAAVDTNGIGQFTTIRGSDTVKAGTALGATYSYFIPGGALVQSSDESLKANILPYTANLANFKLVTPRTYNFKKEVFLETFDRKSVPDSVDVKIDSVTIRVSNLAAKDSAAVAFYVNNLAYAERKSKIAYRGFLANEFNPLLLGKQSREINQQDEINVLWLKVQELEKRIEKLEGK